MKHPILRRLDNLREIEKKSEKTIPKKNKMTRIRLAPKTKKFGGVTYYLYTDGNKQHCQRLANRARKDDQLARVVKVAGTWAVYTKPKKR